MATELSDGATLLHLHRPCGPRMVGTYQSADRPPRKLAECFPLIEASLVIVPADPHAGFMSHHMPKRARIRMVHHYAEAFVRKAIELDRLPLAPDTALQFETGMRQQDVMSRGLP